MNANFLCAGLIVGGENIIPTNVVRVGNHAASYDGFGKS